MSLTPPQAPYHGRCVWRNTQRNFQKPSFLDYTYILQYIILAAPLRSAASGAFGTGRYAPAYRAARSDISKLMN